MASVRDNWVCPLTDAILLFLAALVFCRFYL